MSKSYSETDRFGNIYWYKEGTTIYHKEDGPACEYVDGDKAWYKEGKLHRENAPAIEFANGGRAWFKNDKYHREDGPALELTDGTKKWYYYGKHFPEINSLEEFIIKIILE